jgi:hypothetical protein
MTPNEPSTARPADPTAGTAAEDVRRPAPHWWIWYALGGHIPARYKAWVLHDTTTRTWVLRHVARALVQLSIPIALVLLFVPGPLWIRAMSALAGIILGLAFSLAYATETIENRCVKAGYPAGTAQATRDRSARARDERDGERRRAAAAKRADRYRTDLGR